MATLPYADYVSALETYTPQQIVGQLETQFPSATFGLTGSGGINISDPSVRSAAFPTGAGVGNFPFTNVLDPKRDLEGFYNTLIGLEDQQYANIVNQYLAPAFTSLAQQQASPVVDTRPIAKAGPIENALAGPALGPFVSQDVFEAGKTLLDQPVVDPIIGETQQPPPATVPLEPSPRIAEAARPSIPTERQTLEGALTATPTTPTQATTPPTPAPVADRVAEPTPPQAQPTPIDTRTAQEKATDEYFDLVNRVKFGGQEILKRPLTRDPAATTAITREVAAERPPTQGLVLNMPLTSRYSDRTAANYLRGGLDAFAYSGPQGYADVRQQMVGEPADVFTGPEVDWQRLAQPAPSDIYLGTEFPDISVDDILANIPKVDPKLSPPPPPTPKAFADTTAELVEIDRDNLFDRVREDYGELELERKEDLKNRINSFMPEAGDLSPYPVDLRSGEAEDFKFYEHPKTKAVVGNIIGNIKNVITKAGDGVEVAVNHLKGLTDELTRFVERNGGRSSVEQQAWGPTLLGVTDILTGDLKGFDKQTQGDIQWAAVAIAIAEYGTPIGNAIGAMQLANTIKDWGKSTVNVSTFDSPLYESGNQASFDAAYRDSIEFVGDVLRPMAKTISKYTLDKLAKDVPADASVRQKLQAVFGREVGEMEGPKQFAITDQEPVQGPQQDPTGQITLEESTPFSEAPASRIGPQKGQENFRPGTETPILPGGGQAVNVDYTPPFEGQGVSAGPAPVVGSSLPDVTPSIVEPTLSDPITVNITPPVAESPFTGMGVGAGLAPGVTSDLPLTNTPISDGVIPTLDTEFQSVTGVESRPRFGATTGTTPFTGVTQPRPSFDPVTITEGTPPDVPSQFTGMGVSAGPSSGPVSTLPGAELIPVDSDNVPTEPADAINASLPVDANGQVTTNLKDIVGFRNLSTNAGSLAEMFGGGEAGARAASAIAAGAGPEYGNPLPKLREQWNIQQTQTLEDELKTKVIESFVQSTGSPEGFKQWKPNYQNDIKNRLDINYKSDKEKFGDNFPLSLSIYKTLIGSDVLRDKKAFKDNFTEALKEFSQEKIIISDLDKPLNLDNIEESVNLDNSAILENMGIRMENLRNVGTDFSGERPNIYKEPVKELFEEQFTSDRLVEVIQPQLNIEDLRNHPNRDSIIEDLKAEGRLEPDFEFPEAKIDEASEEFADRTFVRFDKKLSIDDIIERYFRDYDDDDFGPGD